MQAILRIVKPTIQGNGEIDTKEVKKGKINKLIKCNEVATYQKRNYDILLQIKSYPI